MNVLLTLGRMPKGLELARGLKAAGCTVFVADPHKNHVCRHSNVVTKSIQVTAPNVSETGYLDDMITAVQTHDIELVIPVSEESVYAAKLIARLPDGVQFFGPTFEAARDLHDKLRFNQLAAAHGLSVPTSARLGSPEADAIVAASNVIIKPIHASAGIDIETVPKGSSLPASRPRPSLVQQKICGRLLSCLSLARDGQCLGTAVYEGTIFSGSVAIAFQRAADSAPVEAWAARFIEATGYSGFISFDMFIEDDGHAYAIECNPRLTSGIHLFDNADLARAAITPDRRAPVQFRTRQAFQHFWPCLGVTEMALIKGGFREKFHHFIRSADITWSSKDFMPFVMMNFCSMEILKNCWRGQMSLGEAAITDVEWRG